MGRLLDAFRSGDASYAWSDVTSSHGGHTATFRMFRDAARIGDTRWACSAREAQQIADHIGAVLPTPLLLDLRHDQAQTKIDPQTQSPCTSSDAAIRLHSLRISEAAKLGPGGIVSPVGKQWCLGAGEPWLYGWMVPSATWKHGRRTWRGIPVQPSVSRPDQYVIQSPSTGRHSLDQIDYSMFLVLVHGECIVDGQRMPTRDVYTSAGLCGLAVAHGAPLSPARYSGVPEPLGGAQAPTAPQRGTLGQRLVAWCRAEMANGVCEVPPGSNGGPRIAEYHGCTIRDGRPVGIKRGPWCASAISYGLTQCAIAGKHIVPRCSGYELEQDAKASGTWAEEPRCVGDLCILARGSAWERHVCAVLSMPDEHGDFVTIGGNEGDHWRITDRNIYDAAVRGFVILPCAGDPELVVNAVRDSAAVVAKALSEIGRWYE